MSHKAIFLDRDGVINKEKEQYITTCKDFELLPRVGEFLKKLQDLGYILIIITNQSAINRELTTHEELRKIHELMKDQLLPFGVCISGIYYCPHRPDEHCDCRKPKIKMFSMAIKDHDVDIRNSWLVGDKETDVEAGKIIGLRTIKMETNSSLEYVISKIKDRYS